MPSRRRNNFILEEVSNFHQLTPDVSLLSKFSKPISLRRGQSAGKGPEAKRRAKRAPTILPERLAPELPLLGLSDLPNRPRFYTLPLHTLTLTLENWTLGLSFPPAHGGRWRVPDDLGGGLLLGTIAEGPPSPFAWSRGGPVWELGRLWAGAGGRGNVPNVSGARGVPFGGEAHALRSNLHLASFQSVEVVRSTFAAIARGAQVRTRAPRPAAPQAPTPAESHAQ